MSQEYNNLLKDTCWSPEFVANVPTGNTAAKGFWRREVNGRIAIDENSNDSLFKIWSVAASGRYGFFQDVTLKKNTTYTLSLDIGEEYHVGVGTANWPSENTFQPNEDDDRVHYTFTTGTTQTHRVYIFGNRQTGLVSYVNNLMLNEGDTPLPWTFNADDQDAPDEQGGGAEMSRNLLRSTNNAVDIGAYSTGTRDYLWDRGRWQIGSGTSGNGGATCTEIEENGSPADGINYMFTVWSTNTSNKEIHQAGNYADSYNLRQFPFFKKNATYTISGWCRVASDSAVASPKRFLRLYNTTAGSYHKQSAVAISNTEWARFSWSFKITVDPETNYLHFDIGISGKGKVQYCGLKLEFGSEATDWEPAPEDKYYIPSLELDTLASDEITIASVNDITDYTRYYLLQSSTLDPPAKPTTETPGSSWSDTEPTYTSGSTNSLYFVDKTTFSDGTFNYSDVSLSSEYEAAKEAYNLAHTTNQNLTSHQNYFWHDSSGAHISDTAGVLTGKNVLIDSNGLQIKDGNDVLAEFEANEISFMEDILRIRGEVTGGTGSSQSNQSQIRKDFDATTATIREELLIGLYRALAGGGHRQYPLILMRYDPTVQEDNEYLSLMSDWVDLHNPGWGTDNKWSPGDYPGTRMNANGFRIVNEYVMYRTITIGTNRTLYLARNGKWVELILHYNGAVAAGSTNLGQIIPEGFRPHQRIITSSSKMIKTDFSALTNTTECVLRIANDGTLTLICSAAADTAWFFNISVSYITSDAWPATPTS